MNASNIFEHRLKIEFFGGITLAMRLKPSFRSVTTKLVGSMLMLIKLLLKSFGVAHVRLPCPEMPIYIVTVTLDIKNL